MGLLLALSVSGPVYAVMPGIRGTADIDLERPQLTRRTALDPDSDMSGSHLLRCTARTCYTEFSCLALAVSQ